MRTGISIITGERVRQEEVEGWTSANDSQYVNGELAIAGACYAMPIVGRTFNTDERVPDQWPWESKWYKPSIDKEGEGRIRELAKAGALIAAEIDRLLLEKASWIPFEKENYEYFDKLVSEHNCLLKFDNGQVQDFHSDLPRAIMTHFTEKTLI